MAVQAGNFLFLLVPAWDGGAAGKARGCVLPAFASSSISGGCCSFITPYQGPPRCVTAPPSASPSLLSFYCSPWPRGWLCSDFGGQHDPAMRVMDFPPPRILAVLEKTSY